MIMPKAEECPQPYWYHHHSPPKVEWASRNHSRTPCSSWSAGPLESWPPWASWRSAPGRTHRPSAPWSCCGSHACPWSRRTHTSRHQDRRDTCTWNRRCPPCIRYTWYWRVWRPSRCSSGWGPSRFPRCQRERGWWWWWLGTFHGNWGSFRAWRSSLCRRCGRCCRRPWASWCRSWRGRAPCKLGKWGAWETLSNEDLGIFQWSSF